MEISFWHLGMNIISVTVKLIVGKEISITTLEFSELVLCKYFSYKVWKICAQWPVLSLMD